MLTVILTGGASSRMGRDKAALPIQGKSMSMTLIDRYARALGPVAVSVNLPGRFEHGQAAELVDSFPGMGPLNGLYSAFSQTDTQMVFLTATDLPNGDPRLALHLAGLIGDHDACIISRDQAKGHYEALFGIYKRSCFEPVKNLLESNRKRFIEFLSAVKTRFVSQEELAGWDLEWILMNVNSLEDYERYSRLI